MLLEIDEPEIIYETQNSTNQLQCFLIMKTKHGRKLIEYRPEIPKPTADIQMRPFWHWHCSQRISENYRKKFTTTWKNDPFTYLVKYWKYFPKTIGHGSKNPFRHIGY